MHSSAWPVSRRYGTTKRTAIAVARAIRQKNIPFFFMVYFLDADSVRHAKQPNLAFLTEVLLNCVAPAAANLR
jgi:hypothetical protein